MQEEFWPGNYKHTATSGKEHGDDIAIAIFPEVHYGVLSSLALAAPYPQGVFSQCLSQLSGKEHPDTSACGDV